MHFFFFENEYPCWKTKKNSEKLSQTSRILFTEKPGFNTARLLNQRLGNMTGKSEKEQFFAFCPAPRTH